MALPPLPTGLTLLRLVLAPVVTVLLADGSAAPTLAGGLLFIVGALTDLWDGRIARRSGRVTDFGRIADPIADKALVLGALGALAWRCPAFVPSWMAVVIAAREVGVTAWRLARLRNGEAIAADVWGKWKTTFQMIAIIYTAALAALAAHLGAGDGLRGALRLAAWPGGRWALVLPYVATLTAMLLTVVSGIETIAANRRRPP